MTEGATFDEAVANAQEAIAGFVETMIHLGEPVPREEPSRAVVSIEVNVVTEAVPAETVA